MDLTPLTFDKFYINDLFPQLKDLHLEFKYIIKMDKIIDKLYLGNLKAASDHASLT